jgi:hypothetical protein
VAVDCAVNSLVEEEDDEWADFVFQTTRLSKYASSYRRREEESRETGN